MNSLEFLKMKISNRYLTFRGPPAAAKSWRALSSFLASMSCLNTWLPSRWCLDSLVHRLILSSIDKGKEFDIRKYLETRIDTSKSDEEQNETTFYKILFIICILKRETVILKREACDHDQKRENEVVSLVIPCIIALRNVSSCMAYCEGGREPSNQKLLVIGWGTWGCGRGCGGGCGDNWQSPATQLDIAISQTLQAVIASGSDEHGAIRGALYLISTGTHWEILVVDVDDHTEEGHEHEKVEEVTDDAVGDVFIVAICTDEVKPTTATMFIVACHQPSAGHGDQHVEHQHETDDEHLHGCKELCGQFPGGSWSVLVINYLPRAGLEALTQYTNRCTGDYYYKRGGGKSRCYHDYYWTGVLCGNVKSTERISGGVVVFISLSDVMTCTAGSTAASGAHSSTFCRQDATPQLPTEAETAEQSTNVIRAINLKPCDLLL